MAPLGSVKSYRLSFGAVYRLERPQLAVLPGIGASVVTADRHQVDGTHTADFRWTKQTSTSERKQLFCLSVIAFMSLNGCFIAFLYILWSCKCSCSLISFKCCLLLEEVTCSDAQFDVPCQSNVLLLSNQDAALVISD